jgi:ribosomal protein S12 methylthiotransferase accessory factor
LLDGRLVWMPALMVYMHIHYRSIGERIWLPISTGSAAHVSYERALLSAICEVIERDAISIVWLQKLGLPRIELDTRLEELEPYLARERNTTIQHLFFDATTDLGVPTVYALQLSPHAELSTLVMCSTELDPVMAIQKVTREAASSRIAFRVNYDVPESWDDFHDVMHGAKYMGRPENVQAFDFLLKSPAQRRLSDMPRINSGDSREDLRRLLASLRRRGIEVFAVDLTSDEAARAGLRVVRATIPTLQPLSFSYRARFLGHPRLYDLPRQMGYPVRSEGELNVYPQPFA